MSSMAAVTITDSIAIRILNQHAAVITGVGNELHLYTTTRKEQVLPIRLQGKIHGIECNRAEEGGRNLLLAYGEKEFVLIEWTSEYHYQLLQRLKLTDWISAAKFLTSTEEFVLLTAHSVLLHFSYDAKLNTTWRCQLIGKISCADKSTLYCAHIDGDSWEQLVIFGGNAFGELLIWQPNLRSGTIEEKKACAILLQRIPAHNGVIFSINYNQAFNLLITTSDDRSVKFWHVKLKGTDWSSVQLKPLASGFGHVARVFQAKIIDFDSQPFCITVGEDSYACIWRINGELLYKRRMQFDAIIWNLAYEATTQTLFTVGATGNLHAYGLKSVLSHREQEISVMPHVNPANSSDYVAKVKFLSSGTLLVGVTNKNQFVYCKLSVNCYNWCHLDLIERFKCTVLEVHEDLIALCGYKRLTLLKYNKPAHEFIVLFDGEILCGVVRAFQFLDARNFLISDELGNCLLLKGEDLQQRYVIDLPKYKECSVTSALLLEMKFLLLSNRQGHVLLYKYNEQLDNFELKHILKHLHGNLGATMLQSKSASDSNIYVRTAGHDGTLKLITLNRENSELTIFTRVNVPVTWVESVASLQDATIDLLLGFNDNHFVIWSQMHDFLLQIPCGGGHRCWHYCIYKDVHGDHWLRLVFIKTKKVLLHHAKIFNELTTKIQLPERNNWHVRPCNNVVLVEEQPREEDLVVISAGDDNLIKFTHLTKRKAEFKQRAELHSHISNIRALQVYQLSRESYLIFSGGGRAQLCITKYNVSSFQIEELVNYTLHCSAGGGGVYKQQGSHSFAPETRIMCLDVLPAKNNENGADGLEIFIYLGCSDGYIRKLLFKRSLEIVVVSELYYGKCILQLRVISESFVLTGATDGLVKFHNLDLNAIHLSLQHHSSGINALDVMLDESSQILHLLTGGDDQAVAYSKIGFLEEQPLTVLHTVHLKELHTAQVTAARLFHKDGALYAFTSGVDQQLYKLLIINNSFKIIGSFYSCIADIKGLSLTKHEDCFIYGCGLQLYNFFDS